MGLSGLKVEDKANLCADTDASWGKLQWVIGDSVGAGPGDVGTTTNRDSLILLDCDALGRGKKHSFSEKMWKNKWKAAKTSIRDS